MKKIIRGAVVENVAFKYLLCILGGLTYSVGVNLFIKAIGVYNGGIVGVSMLIAHFFEGSVNTNLNIYPFIYVIFNIPILILAFKGVGRRFFVRTLLGVGSIFLFGAIIPVPEVPVVRDTLTAALIGGVLTGGGTGLILLAGGCGGGTDVIGVYLSKKRPNASVGKFTLIFNMTLYLILFFIFDIEVVIYSCIVAFAFSITLDRVHMQNIAMRAMIITKQEGMEKQIISQTVRGVTRLEGIGAYTGEGVHVLISCINKYEEHAFLEEVYAVDPKAFVIIDEHVQVRGNFLKKL